MNKGDPLSQTNLCQRGDGCEVRDFEPESSLSTPTTTDGLHYSDSIGGNSHIHLFTTIMNPPEEAGRYEPSVPQGRPLRCGRDPRCPRVSDVATDETRLTDSRPHRYGIEGTYSER